MSLGFGKREKLCNKSIFEDLIQKGKGVKKYPIRLVYLKTTHVPDDLNQVAFSVPKRKFKRAVDRNRIKRLLKEAYRLQKPTLLEANMQGYAFLFIWLKNEMPTYKEVDKMVVSVLNKLIETENS